MIDTNNILAINYIRVGIYKRSEEILYQSLKLAEKLDNSYLLSDVYHNLGYLNSKKTNHSSAIDFYKTSLGYKENNYDSYTNTIYYLVKEYLEIKEYEKANEWLGIGLKLSEKFSLKHNKIKLETIRTTENINKEVSRVQLEEEIIPYYLKNNHWYEASENAELLGNFYFNKKIYKKASLYYRLANDSRNKIQKIILK